MQSSPTSHIHEHIFSLIFLIRGQMASVVHESESSLSPMQILLLRILVEEGEIPQNLLTKKMFRDKAQITRLINTLVTQKLLTKEKDLLDKRGFILKPSLEAHHIVGHFIIKEQALVSKMLKGIPYEDIEKLETLLKIAHNNLTK
jgi:MarR family transcriptional regulator, multiple antibiotic resistance protein MarR